MNQYETQALIEEFNERGIKVTAACADFCVINTCSVTRHADVKSRDAILKARKENPGAFVAAIGCLAQLNQSYLHSLGVDCIVPQEYKHNCVDMLLNQRPRKERTIWSLKISRFFRQRAFVKIQDGCNHFCTFCKIPYLRGKPTSRPRRDIFEEIRRVSSTHQEVVLCGVNIGFYGRERSGTDTLASLVKDILAINSLQRLRLSSLAPYYIGDDLLALFENNKLCPHIHLPFQSGDDRILKLMNKRETQKLYRTVVCKVRDINSLIALSCDIMVGFPGEDEQSFTTTLNFLNEVQPMRTHIFSFSSRECTSFEYTEVERTHHIREYFVRVREASHKWAGEYKKKFMGKTLTMICEQRENGYLYGYTENYLKVCIPDTVPIGAMVKVKITKVISGQMYGEPVKHR